jgi:hemerythrin-like domain-containing protein
VADPFCFGQDRTAMQNKALEASSLVRRRALKLTALTGLALIGCASNTSPARAANAEGNEKEEAEVTPGEDLMQEHGVLERVLLIYDESARRLEAGERLDLNTVDKSADIVRRFVEEYHERLEERFVFPRLQQAGRETELVTVLLRQHQRGREVTAEIQRQARAASGAQLAPLLRSFARMYRPHAAREDTVLFPALRKVVDRAAYLELGEQFEDEEHQRFGEHGFENTVKEVAELEASLDIADLAKWTP